MKTCPKCGAVNGDQYKKCDDCGAPLPLQSDVLQDLKALRARSVSDPGTVREEKKPEPSVARRREDKPRSIDTSLDCDGYVRAYPTLGFLAVVFKVLAWMTLLAGGGLALQLAGSPDTASPVREGQGVLDLARTVQAQNVDYVRHALTVACVFSPLISLVALLAISHVNRLLLESAHDWSVTALATRRSFEES